MAHAAVIAIIGGSGLYDLEGLTDQRWAWVDSPFGAPSDELLFGKLGDVQVVFWPRHGRSRWLGAVRPRGADRPALGADRLAVRCAVRLAVVREARRCAGGVLAAARPRAPDPAARDQLSGEHRCAEAGRCDVGAVGERGGVTAAGPAARDVRARGSVHRPHAARAEDVLHDWVRGACVDGAP